MLLIFQDLLEDTGWLASQLNNTETMLNSIEVDGGETSNLRDELNKLRGQHQTLQGELSELVAEMETGAQIVEQFQVRD